MKDPSGEGPYDYGAEEDRGRMLDAIAGSSDVQTALNAMQRHHAMSYVTYHMARATAGTVDAPFVRTTYPNAWISRYLLKGYVAVDPIVREGFYRRLPFRWDEIQSDGTADAFLADATEHGVGAQGLSIPVTDKQQRRGLLSINATMSADRWIVAVQRHGQEWAILAQIVHQIAVRELFGEADPVPPLARREQECLHWTALGKDIKDIAVILELSEHTVRDYLKSARLKLGCATRSAAATRAIHLGIITPWPVSPPQNGG